jgi:hypothetical protein
MTRATAGLSLTFIYPFTKFSFRNFWSAFNLILDKGYKLLYGGVVPFAKEMV